MRSEYAQTVVLCRSFWLQSTNTCPVRFGLRHVDGRRASGRAPRAAARARARTPWCRRRSTSGPLSGTERCRPLPPDVFTTAIETELRRAARAARARRGSSRARRRAARDRGRARPRVGRVRVGQRPLVGVQLERGEVREPHERREVFDDAAALAAVGLERFATRRTHAGWWGGQRFSKNRSPSAPSGARTRVGGRPGQVGEHHRRDPAVVVDDVGFAEARPPGTAACRGWRAPAPGRRSRRLTLPSAISRMDPMPSCHLDRLDQLRPRASAREARRRDQEQGRQLQPAREGTGRAHPLPQGLRPDRRRGHRRSDRARLRDLEGPLRDRRARRDRRRCGRRAATRSRSRSSSTSTRSTRSTSSSRTTSSPTSAARSRTRCSSTR